MLPSRRTDRAVRVRSQHAQSSDRGRCTRRPDVFDHRRAARRQVLAEHRLQRRNGASSADRWLLTTISAWAGHWLVGRTMTCASKSLSRVRGIQLRVGRRDTRRRQRAARSISSIPPPTTSTGSPIRSAGKTSTMCGPGSSSDRSRSSRSAAAITRYWLATARDALYSAGGAVLARIAAGAPDRHVGQELDIQATFTPSARVQMHRRLLAHLFPARS